jgi:integrase
MEARGVVPMHRENTRRHLGRLAEDCGFARLGDLRREALERWLADEARGDRSARSRNAHRTALVSFGNWCVAVDRLASNPFKGVPRANEAADPRRRRRAMTEDELARLLEVARARPLLDAMTVRRGERKGEAYAMVRDGVRARLEALGLERALIYKTLVLTGLRKNELASLTVAQLRLDAPTPHLELDAADEKSREGNGVAIRPDLAADLRAWLEDRLASLQGRARSGESAPARLPGDTPVFDIPAGLVRIFDRDLKAAGIAKRDERGRTLDVHALRTTFGTLLSKGGVPLRTAQAAMRHSDPSLTANVYTDPKLLDVQGALGALPSLPLGAGQGSTGIGPAGPPDDRQFALAFAAPHGKPGQSVAIGDKENGPDRPGAGAVQLAATGFPGKDKGPVTAPVNALHSIGAAGFEPTTSRPPVYKCRIGLAFGAA